MPGWIWFLIAFGLFILGAVWLGYLVWQLKFSFKKLVEEVAPIVHQVNELGNAQAKKPEAKKRRLVPRLSTRK